MPKKRKRTSRPILRGFIFLTTAVVIAVFLFAGWTGSHRRDPAEAAGVQVAPQVIRFHVLAHSDDPADQAVKNRVRDQVLHYLTPALASAGSLEEVQSLLQGEMDRLREFIVQLLELWEVEGEVTLLFQEQEFPTRSYAGRVYPSGTYQTFTVVLGEGRGENWWCVMFPPLCLTELALIRERSRPQDAAALEGDTHPVGGPALPAEENSSQTMDNPDERKGSAPVLRFKILSWLRGLKR